MAQGKAVGPRNAMWKGGRVVEPRGYVLIRVGKDHPLADVRGYAYEHRLVASRKLGRLVTKKEIAHHEDEIKSNNLISNLIVVGSHAEHGLHHRIRHKGLRMPDESNPAISCGCGCKKKFSRYDSTGRPRKFIPGHNPQESPTLDAVQKAVNSGATTVGEVLRKVGTSKGSVKQALSTLSSSGLIVRRMRGLYGPLGSQPARKQVRIECLCRCGKQILKYDRYWRERKYISGHNGRTVKNG